MFDNCATGIRASGVNAYVFNTSMEGVNTGLRLASCRDKSLRIWGNDIQARDMGIALLQNNPRFCSVFDNTVTLETVGAFQDRAAIVVDENPFGAGGYNRYLIRDNTANVVTAGTGIRLGTAFQCNAETGYACSIAIPPTGEESGEEDELLQKLADGSFESPKFEEALKWTGQRHLYHRLLKKGEEELESWEEDFLDEYESTTVGEFSLVDTSLNAAFTLGEHTTAALDSLQSEMESKLDSLHWVDWQYNFGIEVDSVALLAKHQALLDSLAGLHQQGEDQIEAIQLYQEDFLDEAELSNNAISASEVFEINEQEVNALFLETVAVGIDSFTETQTTDLWAIANQCPLSGGDAVFKARSLYSLIDPLVKYEDEERCGSEPEERPSFVYQPEGASSFQLIPNPAKDELAIRLHKPLDKGEYLVIYNSRGQVQREVPLEAGKLYLLLDTSPLPLGIYYCTVRGHGINHSTQKLIIIR
ncbi:MAG: hypothetical protein J5I98_29080 [Phaeodactylibacter sp.]|nr:hypothetical protein [Phaeodactylibacter sp.]